jgi:hypothetical protein
MACQRADVRARSSIERIDCFFVLAVLCMRTVYAPVQADASQKPMFSDAIETFSDMRNMVFTNHLSPIANG